MLARLGVVVMNAPQRFRVTLGRIDTRKDNGLIGAQSRRFVDRMRVAPVELEAALGSCHEEGE